MDNLNENKTLLKVTRQMALEAEERLGYKLSEVLFPINPLLLPSRNVTYADILLLKQWDSVWDSVRDSVWAYNGSFFPKITIWKYVDNTDGVYPFQPCVDLWKSGLVPSFDGESWRLHSGKDAAVVWEGKL